MQVEKRYGKLLYRKNRRRNTEDCNETVNKIMLKKQKILAGTNRDCVIAQDIKDSETFSELEDGAGKVR